MNVKHLLELSKCSARKLNLQSIRSQLDKIIDRACGGGRAERGWSCKIDNRATMDDPFMGEEGKGYEYRILMSFACKPKRERAEEVIDKEWRNMVSIVAAAGNAPGWSVRSVDGEEGSEDSPIVSEEVGYVPVEIPGNWRSHLEHIYDRDSQIDIIMSSLRAALATDFHDRFHCALIGDPACGKTATLQGIVDMVGQAAVLQYDATATTQAGAIKDLDERDEMPRLLVIEEIEKTDENSLRWLLGVLDQRAEIRKTTFRGNIQKDTHMLALATVNDFKLFEGIMYGALASRFAHHIHFPTPSADLLERILTREIARAGGDKRWIKPAMKYGFEKRKITDPRKLVAICLCGRDELLNGEYQRKYDECTKGLSR